MQERALVQMFTKTLEPHTHHVAVVPGTAPFLKLHYSVVTRAAILIIFTDTTQFRGSPKLTYMYINTNLIIIVPCLC